MRRKSQQLDYIPYDPESRQQYLSKKKVKKPLKPKKPVRKKKEIPADLFKTFEFLESFSQNNSCKEIISEIENSKITINY
jgi:hypothetical protein